MSSPLKRSAISVVASAATFAAFMVLASLDGSPWNSKTARDGYIALLFVVMGSSLNYAVKGAWIADLKDELSPWSKGSSFRTCASWLISAAGLLIYYLALFGGVALLLYSHARA